MDSPPIQLHSPEACQAEGFAFVVAFLYPSGVESGEIRQTAVEVRENAETLIDGEVNALNDAKYLAAQVAALAHAVEELAKKLENL